MADTDQIDVYENMSDEAFQALAAPAPAEGVSIMEANPATTLEAQLDAPVVEEAAAVVVAEAAPVVAAEVPAVKEADALGAGVTDADFVKTEVTPHHTAPNDTKAKDLTAEGDKAKVTPGSEAGPVTAGAEAKAEPINYESVYKQIMAPFKANNKDFTPSSPEEAIRLMQMGANYTKKMQALTPNLKLMRMLDNNGLLEESKINFLIDLNRKDAGAIQKLLHESKIDPLDLSTSEDPAYTPGNHSVTDQEMAFHESLGDILSAPGGRDTVQMINTQWDRASKEAIYKEPAILAIMHEQRGNGIFDRISAEIDRQKILGNLTNVPFIQAYKSVGDTLHSQGLLVPSAASAAIVPQNNPAPIQQARVLETRTAAPKVQVSNDAAARAASPTKAAAKAAPVNFDPFAMTDAEIMAISSPRA